MKNKLTDLNDHLFLQLERLNNEATKGDNLTQEIERTKAVTDIAKEIVNNATLQLKALEFKAEHLGLKEGEMPKLLTGQTWQAK